MTQDSFFFAIVPQAETEMEPDTEVSQPVAQCTRCETDAADTSSPMKTTAGYSDFARIVSKNSKILCKGCYET